MLFIVLDAVNKNTFTALHKLLLLLLRRRRRRRRRRPRRLLFANKFLAVSGVLSQWSVWS
jgi:hypothetical protein